MKLVTHFFSHAGVLFMRLIAPLPLPLLRAMGWALGWLLYALIQPRRHVVRTNLSLCFPELSLQDRRILESKIFIKFTQAWLDRSWLWHGSRKQLDRRLHVTGDVDALKNEPRLVMFVPHFFGLDAAGMAITKDRLRTSCSIYSSQTNAVVDQWMLEGRTRFGEVRMFARHVGLRDIANAIKAGEALYLLPDMDLGAQGAEFVSFFGYPTATITSLSRFTRLPKARVITVTARITPQGYDVHFSSPWVDFPTQDLVADTQRMNTELEALVRQMPEQYYWVHKRFKTRPPGEPSPY